MGKSMILVVAWLGLIVQSLPGAAAEQASTRQADKGEYAEPFKDLYDHLGKVYPCFEMKGIDWKKVGEELLPRSEKVTTQRDFGLLVLELVARLEDSHAVVQEGTAAPPEPELPSWDPGMTCLMDDRDRPVVYVVEKNSPAQRAGVRVGMAVVSVNGEPAADVMKSWMGKVSRYYGYSSKNVLSYDAVRGFLAQAHKGDRVTLELEAPDGAKSGVLLKADVAPRYIPRLPVPRRGIGDSADVSWTKLDDGIGYIYVRRIRDGLEDSLDDAIRGLRGVKGLIIDVRGNSGGGFDSERALRNFGDDAEEPNRPRFHRAIAVLIDGRTISAGEGWASWFMAKKRARFFGSTTAGASSRKEVFTLKNGFYKVVVPVKAYTGFLDRPIERRGLEPDVEVRCSAKDLAEGRDTVVEKAREWLKSQPATTQAAAAGSCSGN
ncbi:MAG TPA: S41 family peptidase [Tepidisphaeraceae bacterium]|jgi:C-terminal processing protease CtpA/Prc